MLDFSLISIHPGFLDAYRAFGVLRSAEAKGLAALRVVPLRDFAVDQHGTVDDRPYGGGDGMVLRPDALAAAIASLPVKPLVILPSPSGKLWTQAEAAALLARAQTQPLCFICGRFSGVDQRFVDRYVDLEYSLGDYVISGGELAALTMLDSMLRLVAGVLGHAESSSNDSFGAGLGGLLEYPLYTRPEEFEGCPVPDILRSGDHKKIAEWRQQQALTKTRNLRPDLLE